MYVLLSNVCLNIQNKKWIKLKGITVIWCMNIYGDIFSEQLICRLLSKMFNPCLEQFAFLWLFYFCPIFFIFKLSGEMPKPNDIRGSVQGMNAEWFLPDDSRQTSISLVPWYSACLAASWCDCCASCIITWLAYPCSLTWSFSLPLLPTPCLGVALAPGGTEWSDEERLRIQGAGLPCTDLVPGKCHFFSPHLVLQPVLQYV